MRDAFRYWNVQGTDLISSVLRGNFDDSEFLAGDNSGRLTVGNETRRRADSVGRTRGNGGIRGTDARRANRGWTRRR